MPHGNREECPLLQPTCTTDVGEVTRETRAAVRGAALEKENVVYNEAAPTADKLGASRLENVHIFNGQVASLPLMLRAPPAAVCTPAKERSSMEWPRQAGGPSPTPTETTVRPGNLQKPCSPLGRSQCRGLQQTCRLPAYGHGTISA
ncbi:hypothetical protein NDU88_003586 [Pleurodeles waltl]|uniref:Uncharacterized protein n=1 Tax=Pleurodeles waltl TaxID=8319 RepID=A0AAV7TPH9_PLEWA|nr:hypothetical protein NDU88_003586 [Pleurodeles waltl]